MSFFRAYHRPSDEPGYNYVEPPIEDYKEIAYTDAFRQVCAEHQGERPAHPQICPRCNERAYFHHTLCYKTGKAGAWILLVSV